MTQTSETPQPRSPESAHLPFTTLMNFRDVGGARTADGGRIRTGRLYRSATPQFLDAAEARRLVHDIGVRTRIDLRGRTEASEADSPALAEAGVGVAHLPLYAGGRRMADSPPRSSTAIAAHYLRYLEHAADSLTRMVRTLGERPRLPALVHCAAGKDRTGAAVALVLAAVGADRDDIVADYARTGAHLDAIHAQLSGVPAYQQRLAAMPEETFSAFPDTMEVFLDRLDADHGGARGYLVDRGVTTEELRRLTDALVE
ncbi:tyrosine-protein phosphatase [Thermobifida halotolerans]|uniref:tyrosine-protein phosphatase n=1 Tax=Thermobifida halotolerans TaxID=483545 RepID=UPI001F2A8F31|nr:tyrosine-protein phosphatase [Thermobifida halotolerans]